MKEANISYGIYAEVKGQVSRMGSLLPPCCSWGLSSIFRLYDFIHGVISLDPICTVLNNKSTEQNEKSKIC